MTIRDARIARKEGSNMKLRDIFSAAMEDRYTKKRLIWSGVTLGLMVVTLIVGSIGQRQGWWEMELTQRGVILTPIHETEQAADSFDPTTRFYETAKGTAVEAVPVAQRCPECRAVVGLESESCSVCGFAGALIPQVKCPVCGALHAADDAVCPLCEAG